MEQKITKKNKVTSSLGSRIFHGCHSGLVSLGAVGEFTVLSAKKPKIMSAKLENIQFFNMKLFFKMCICFLTVEHLLGFLNGYGC